MKRMIMSTMMVMMLVFSTGCEVDNLRTTVVEQAKVIANQSMKIESLADEKGNIRTAFFAVSGLLIVAIIAYKKKK